MFPRFFQLLTTVKRSISHIFNSLRVPFFLIFFLFCLKISRVFSPKPPKLSLIQPTKFPPQNTSKSESMNFPRMQHRWLFILDRKLLIAYTAIKNNWGCILGRMHLITIKKKPKSCYHIVECGDRSEARKSRNAFNSRKIISLDFWRMKIVHWA